jgi:ribonuclease III
MKIVGGYEFKNDSLLNTAFTHISATLHKKYPPANYQRLEFLGDSVLQIIVSEYLYSKFANVAEGQLAKRRAAIVQGKTLADVALQLGLDKLVEIGLSEEKLGIRQSESLLSDIMESVIGAMYLDSDLETSRRYVLEWLGERLDNYEGDISNPKSYVQEWLQKQSKPLPKYEVTSSSGASHKPEFTIALVVEGYSDTLAIDGNKKSAEIKAAKEFIKLYLTNPNA